jgi:acetyl esterase/lipase
MAAGAALLMLSVGTQSLGFDMTRMLRAHHGADLASAATFDIARADVKYGPDRRQKLRIWRPAGVPARRPTILFVHGGCWTGGSWLEFAAQAEQVAEERGWVGAVMEYRKQEFSTYRLSNLYKNEPADVASALATLRELPDVDSERVVLVGGSAGAHLITNNAYKAPTSIKPRALVSYSGPADLFNVSAQDCVQQFTAKRYPTDAEAADRYRMFSPMNFVSADDPATMLVYAQSDSYVPPSNATTMADALQRAGVPVELVQAAPDCDGNPTTVTEHSSQLLPCTWTKAVAWIAQRIG